MQVPGAYVTFAHLQTQGMTEPYWFLLAYVVF